MTESRAMPALPRRSARECRAGSPDPASVVAKTFDWRGRETPPYIYTETASAFRRIARSIARGTVALLRGAIWLYQHTVSPALSVAAPSCGCRFAPTCSHYAETALREHGLFAGLALAARRLVKCGPWHPGGIDPVPPRRFSCTSVNPSLRRDRLPITAHRSLSAPSRSLS